jgi:hypothetical protein
VNCLRSPTFGEAALKQKMETGAFVPMFRPFTAGGIANLADGESGEFAPPQHFPVEKIRLGFFNESAFHSKRRRLAITASER